MQSLHVGSIDGSQGLGPPSAAQVPFTHVPLAQSALELQCLPAAHGRQSPPQSTSDSGPFVTPSMHVGGPPPVEPLLVEPLLIELLLVDGVPPPDPPAVLVVTAPPVEAPPA